MNYGKKAMLVAGALLCLNFSMYSQSMSLKIKDVSVKKGDDGTSDEERLLFCVCGR